MLPNGPEHGVQLLRTDTQFELVASKELGDLDSCFYFEAVSGLERTCDQAVTSAPGSPAVLLAVDLAAQSYARDRHEPLGVVDRVLHAVSVNR